MARISATLMIALIMASPVRAGSEETQSEVLGRGACTDGVELALTMEKAPMFKPDDSFHERVVTFQLVAYPEPRDGSGKVLWQAKTAFTAGLFPWPQWVADIDCDPSQDRVVLAMVTSVRVTTAVLDIFSIPLDGSGRSEALPQGPKVPGAPELSAVPLAHYEERLSFESGGVEAVESELEQGTLAVAVKPCAPDVAPVRLEVDLASGEVRRLKGERGASPEGESKSMSSPAGQRAEGGNR